MLIFFYYLTFYGTQEFWDLVGVCFACLCNNFVSETSCDPEIHLKLFANTKHISFIFYFDAFQKRLFSF